MLPAEVGEGVVVETEGVAGGAIEGAEAVVGEIGDVVAVYHGQLDAVLHKLATDAVAPVGKIDVVHVV